MAILKLQAELFTVPETTLAQTDHQIEFINKAGVLELKITKETAEGEKSCSYFLNPKDLKELSQFIGFIQSLNKEVTQ